MQITTDFDGANIECVSLEKADQIRLRIKNDNNSEHFQWFYFRLTGAKHTPCKLIIENASDVSYLDGFKNYQAVFSDDNNQWLRTETEFDGKNLIISHTPNTDSVYFAYFAPYTWERHRQLVDIALQSERVELLSLGITLDGRTLDGLRVSAAIGQEYNPNKKNAWVIARQHPGETMAEWWMEGFIHRLLDENDPVARTALSQYDFYIVPNMNPDGSVRGHLRTNAIGSNLNREWLEPTLEKSPEVVFVRQAMKKTGVDFCLDVHGDEALPYNFIAGTEGIPSWNETKQQQLDNFKDTLQKINSDFQTTKGYPVNAPGTANMTLCSNFIAEHFDCLAMTLEMPFKDTADTPMPTTGWSPARCIKLGESCLEAIAQSHSG